MNKITRNFVIKNYPRRTVDSHKNLNGRVLIAAGSKNMPGAAILCATACYRAGAGFVTLAVPQSIAAACAAAVPEALILQTEETDGKLNAAALETILKYLKNTPHDLLLAGPGLSGGAEIILKLLEETKLPAVLDADALNFLAKAGPQKLDKTIPHILTPHEGEMKRLNRLHPKNYSSSPMYHTKYVLRLL
jgi:NAD(P)H-hydrate epimerase